MCRTQPPQRKKRTSPSSPPRRLSRAPHSAVLCETPSCSLPPRPIAQGWDADTLALLRSLHLHEKEQPLAGSRAGILIDGENDFFTKDLGRRIAFAANLCGCALPGKPLVESTSDLHSFTVLASLWQTDRYAAYLKSCRLLVEKLRTFAPVQITRPKLLAVHAGNHKTSNSLSLWQLTAAALADKAEIAEISLRNGQIWDCRGCKYEDCLHFGEQGDCFYGGVMTEKVYPAIIKSDVVVLICPNYNDSVSANIMAFINRLTSVFRVNDFSAKRVYAITVSGYSGGDLVAQQIIGADEHEQKYASAAALCAAGDRQRARRSSADPRDKRKSSELRCFDCIVSGQALNQPPHL